MKKQLLVVLCFGLASAGAYAAGTTVCNKGTPTAVTPAATAKFIKQGFSVKCSANTIVKYEETDESVAVAGASTKGGNVFIGNSAGGSVKADVTKCTGTKQVCLEADVDTAMPNAVKMGTS